MKMCVSAEEGMTAPHGDIKSIFRKEVMSKLSLEDEERERTC